MLTNNPLKRALEDLTTPPAGNVPLLDVFRSLAILLVFSTHFSGIFHASARTMALPFVYYGWSGVDLFFVLSGFLIGAQLWKELRRTGNIMVGRFLLRRGLRIWPLYFSVILFIFCEVLFLGRDGSGLLADLTFLSNYLHCQVGGGWSLSTEEQFYIIAPLTLVLLMKILNLRTLWIVPLGGLCVNVAARAIVIARTGLDFRALQQHLYLPIHTHSDGLAIGLMLAWIAVVNPSVLKSRRAVMILCAVMLMLGAGLYLVSRLLFSYTALGLIFGAGTLFAISGLWTMPSFIRWRGFHVLSRLSYGLYLNHFGLLPRFYNLVGQKQGEPEYWKAYAAGLLICCAFAAITFCLIEFPFLELRSRWLAHAGSAATPVSTDGRQRL